MSDEAYHSYETDRRSQRSRNEARRIRTKVADAKGSRHAAGLRWPFELLQNALDAGPRLGRSSVGIRLRLDESTVYFEHDGAPFTTLELAALLSGGSSKEFESETTTGRFGTGFLVTHVLALSEKTRLQGLLQVEERFEYFEVLLDRSGDEDSILQNIDDCDDSIKAAVTINDISTIESAAVCYPLTQPETVLAGVHALQNALPYLYGTRPGLGRAEFIFGQGRSEVWEPVDSEINSFADATFLSRTLKIVREDGSSDEMRVHRIQTSEKSRAAAIVVTRRAETGWRVEVPHPELPRIFRDYPVRGATFLPINVILDGRFEPDQERHKLHMQGIDKKLLHDALLAATIAVKLAVDDKWSAIHQLCYAAPPTSAFDSEDQEEQTWWKDELREFATSLSRLPVVRD